MTRRLRVGKRVVIPRFWRMCAAATGTLFMCGSSVAHIAGAEEPLAPRQSLAQYDIPAVTLVNQNREKVQLDRLLGENRPAVVEFFFTTCTTICPVRSARVDAVATDLSRDHIEINFLTVSLDPEFDTPTRLSSYARRFGPIPRCWTLLTGTSSDISRVTAAFQAQNPSADKMLHQALTFVRARPGRTWIRIEGMMSSHDLAMEIRRAVASSAVR